MRKKLKEVSQFIDAAKQIVSFGNEWEEKARRDMGSPSCDHCDAPGCCYQMVLATPLEGILIANHIDNLAMNTLEYRAELLQLGEECEDSETRAGWFKRSVPCSFLGKDNKCQVYPWRPVNCRTYFVRTDPVYCLPQKLRDDGQPSSTRVQAVDNTAAITTSLMISQGMVASAGYRIERPYIRSLPAIVSVMMDALLATTPTEFWLTVTTHAPMAVEVFERMMKENDHVQEV